MRRIAYKYRIYPNKEQKEFFARVFGCVRFFYNKSLSDICELYKTTATYIILNFLETINLTKMQYKIARKMEVIVVDIKIYYT